MLSIVHVHGSILAKGFAEIQKKCFYNEVVRGYGDQEIKERLPTLLPLTISLARWSNG
jgi:hypothetical protein